MNAVRRMWSRVAWKSVEFAGLIATGDPFRRNVVYLVLLVMRLRKTVGELWNSDFWTIRIGPCNLRWLVIILVAPTLLLLGPWFQLALALLSLFFPRLQWKNTSTAVWWIVSYNTWQRHRSLTVSRQVVKTWKRKLVTQTFWLDSEVLHGRWVAFRIPGLKNLVSTFLASRSRKSMAVGKTIEGSCSSKT